MLRPGATAIVVGIAPQGVEVALPALELLSREGAPRLLLRLGERRGRDRRSSRGSRADGRFPLADVVTHVTDLDGIDAAFGRLRAGEGARTVVVLDRALAGDPPV